MNILMIVPHYEPDLGPCAPMFAMLGTELVKRGHEVTVITSVPHYPSGHVPPAYRGFAVRKSVEKGVRVLRVPLPSLKRSNLFLRMLQFSLFQLGATWAGTNLPFDVALTVNPALCAWLPFAWLITRRRKPAVFSVWDVYPDVGVALSVFRHRWVIDAVARLERYCLEHSSAVSILSESFRPGLRALGVPNHKMRLIDLWVDTELIQPMARANPFAREHGLAESFVLLYAGNLGLSQGLETVLDTAELLRDEKDVRFVFVGDGTGRQSLICEAARRGLSNVMFLPFQPRQRLPEVMATASASLVLLRKGITAGSLPSKTFSILASGRPVLAAVDQGSAAWNLVTNSKAGLCVPPESPCGLAEAVVALKNDPGLCDQLGRNARSWAVSNHSPAAAALKFEELFADAMTFVP